MKITKTYIEQTTKTYNVGKNKISDHENEILIGNKIYNFIGKDGIIYCNGSKFENYVTKKDFVNEVYIKYLKLTK